MKPAFVLTVSLLSYCCLSLPALSVQAQNGADSEEPQKAEEVVQPVVNSDKKTDKPQKRVFGKSEEESYEGKIVVIKVGERDLVNKQAFKFWRRVLERVNDEKARAVVFELNTPGGYAFDTAKLIMNGMQDIKVPSFAFVNREATSAGALIASGTDHIYMHPISTIGSAELVSSGGADIGDAMKRKLNSFFDATIRTISKEKGRNPDVIRAMMFEDEYFDFGVVQVEQGELLNLSSHEAVAIHEGKPLLAKGIVESVEELLEKEGLGEYQVIEAKPTGMEKFAFMVAAFSGILILIGIGGAYLEMKTPGFGVGGLISLLAFALFFFGNYVAGNMAGYGLMLLFILGVVLVVVELFIIPGMIIPGVIGGILILVSLFVAMVDKFAIEDNEVRGWDTDGILKAVNGPSLNLAIGLVGSAILMMLMMRFLPNIPLFNKLVMTKELSKGNATDEDSISGGTGEHVGLRGKTTTDLRPAGKGEFEERTLDITAANGFIEAGKDVVVIAEDGLRILVEEE